MLHIGTGKIWLNKDPTFCTWEVREVFLCDNYLLECSTDGMKIIGYAQLSGARINLKPCHFPFISNTVSSPPSNTDGTFSREHSSFSATQLNKNEIINNNEEGRNIKNNDYTEFNIKNESKEIAVSLSLSVPRNTDITQMDKENSSTSSTECSRGDLVRGVSISSSSEGSDGGDEGGGRGSGRPVWSAIGDVVRSASDTTHDDWISSSPTPSTTPSQSSSTSTSISSSLSASIQPPDAQVTDRDNNNNNHNDNSSYKSMNDTPKPPHLPSPTDSNLNKKMVKKNSPKMGLKSLKSVFDNCDSPQYNRSMQFYAKHKNNDNNTNNSNINPITNHRHRSNNDNDIKINNDNNIKTMKNNNNRNNTFNNNKNSEHESIDNNCLGIKLSCLSNSSNKENTPRSEFWIRLDEKKNVQNLKIFLENESNEKNYHGRYENSTNDYKYGNENERERRMDDAEKELFMDFRDEKTKSFASSHPVPIPRHNTTSSSSSFSSSYSSSSTSSPASARVTATAVVCNKDEMKVKKYELEVKEERIKFEKEKNYKNFKKEKNGEKDENEKNETSGVEKLEIVEKSRMEKLLEILRFAGWLTVESMYDFSSNGAAEKVEKDRKRGSDDDYEDNMNTSTTSLLGKGNELMQLSFTFFS